MIKNVSMTSHLRIAMLGHKRIPSREGGIEVVVEELSGRMVRMGHDVTCYNRYGHHVSGKEFDNGKLNSYKGIKIKMVPTIEGKGLAAMSSSFFGAVCAAFGHYDVVHFHAEGPCAMMWLPKLMGKRCVATIHGLDHRRAKWGKFASRYIMMGEKTAVRYADEIIVLSKDVRDYFKNVYGRETNYVPNGVNRPAKKEAQQITKEYGLKKNGYLLFLGRLVPEKGLKYLLDAYRKVNTDKPLVIAGGSSDTDIFAEELKLVAAGDDRIIFTGFVHGNKLEELYSNAYLYILPSDVEGMPLSLLEAMSFGNCCLVSDIPECTEVVSDKAVTFMKADTEDLMSKIQMLCDTPEMVSRYKSQAADYITRKYNWDEVVEQTVGLYRGKFIQLHRNSTELKV